MKTVLSFIDWYLPGYRAGGVLKAFANQVAHFEGTVQFKIITRNTDYCETTPYEGVPSDTWVRRSPNSEVFYASKTSLGLFRNMVKTLDYDAVYIHGVYSFWYSILPVLLTRFLRNKRVVVSAHGMLGRHSLSVKSSKKELFLKVASLLGLYKNVIFHAANQAEADDVRKAIGSKAQIMVAEELPMKMELANWKPRPKAEAELRLASVARISPEKNTKYALEVLTQCTKGLISYDIFGPVYDENYWDECLDVIKKMPANVTVTYKGSLQGDQVLDTLSNYHCMFMPTNGENFGHTILESFMSSTPVIISQNTPWRELSNKNAGWDLALDKPADFVETIQMVLDANQDDYNKFSEGALNFAKAFMSDTSILEQNKRLFCHE
jgi:glycosyltransferase involved in cell wall biosynthesis